VSEACHYVVIGNGFAGNKAAAVLRQRDPDGRITIVTEDTLLYYRLASLPKVFVGRDDWRKFLVHQPQYYRNRRIELRRQSLVTEVDAPARRLVLASGETISYDKLLVAAGGYPYLPEHLSDWSAQLQFIYSYEAARQARDELRSDGRVIMLGGDMYGISMGSTMARLGFEVCLLPYDRTFWPHSVSADDMPALLAGVEKLGIEVAQIPGLGKEVRIASIETATNGQNLKRVVFSDGSDLKGDMIMPFFGTLPAVDFMHTAGVEIEHGVVVDKTLRTSNEHIWAIGDACQISGVAPTGGYIHYSRVDVDRMAEVAARNMTDGKSLLSGLHEERLILDERGELETPYLSYELE
jgi:NAD(P)H-nitrite reductase large subunit